MHERHGLSHTRLYKCWSSIRERCLNPKHAYWKDYGGRGIKLCHDWERSFLSFYNWACDNGYHFALEIDRIDNDKDYSPDNCRWTTRKVNFNNRRATRNVTAFGETKTIEEWTKDPRCKLRYATIWARLARGWSGERAVSTQSLIQRSK